MNEEVGAPSPWPLRSLCGFELGMKFDQTVATKFGLTRDLEWEQPIDDDDDTEEWTVENDKLDVGLSVKPNLGVVYAISARRDAIVNGVDLIDLEWDQVKLAIGDTEEKTYQDDLLMYCDYNDGDVKFVVFFWDELVSSVSLGDYSYFPDEP